MIQHEPTLRDMDDYRGEESPQKKRDIINVILAGLFIGVLLVGAKLYFTEVDGEIQGAETLLNAHKR